MKTAVKSEMYVSPLFVKALTSSSKTNTTSSIKNIDIKFYQIFFIVIIALSTFLIFPESPKELENICTNYHSKIMCSKW
jgi:hypothetical protein